MTPASRPTAAEWAARCAQPHVVRQMEEGDRLLRAWHAGRDACARAIATLDAAAGAIPHRP